MPSTSDSRVSIKSLRKSQSTNQVMSGKPTNIFYIWYTELCRRSSVQPLSNVKPAKLKNENVLEFSADRIKPEEWSPIINALRLDTSLHVIAIRNKVQCKFLYDIDTEERAKNMKRRAGSIYTTYILKGLINALISCIRRTKVLSCLELDGLPISIDYILSLVEAIKNNSSIKVLSFKHCPLRDLGCQEICMALRQLPNIEVLKLTSCSLGPISAQYIAKVVKFQQINRYAETWHNSLRYEDPDVTLMAGLKRITLNNNPYIGDLGLIYILDELDDDLWIKAIDMQRCGITDQISGRLIDVIDYSRSLEVADFRNNEQLSPKVLERVFDALKKKQKFGSNPEYQWCMTTTTLPYENVSTINISSCKTSQISKILPKSKSVPLKTSGTKSTLLTPLRRMKTLTSIVPHHQTGDKAYNNKIKSMLDAKNEVMTLNEELRKEITLRVQSEMENKKLRNELEKIKSTLNLNEARKRNIGIREVRIEQKAAKPKLIKNRMLIERDKNKSKVEFIFDNKNKSQVQGILQNFINNNSKEYESDENDETSMSCYFNDTEMLHYNTTNNKNSKQTEYDSDGSNISLIKFMEEIKELKSATINDSNKRTNLWNGYRNIKVVC